MPCSGDGVNPLCKRSFFILAARRSGQGMKELVAELGNTPKMYTRT